MQKLLANNHFPNNYTVEIPQKNFEEYRRIFISPNVNKQSTLFHLLYLGSIPCSTSRNHPISGSTRLDFLIPPLSPFRNPQWPIRGPDCKVLKPPWFFPLWRANFQFPSHLQNPPCWEPFIICQLSTRSIAWLIDSTKLFPVKVASSRPRECTNTLNLFGVLFRRNWNLM